MVGVVSNAHMLSVMPRSGVLGTTVWTDETPLHIPLSFPRLSQQGGIALSTLKPERDAT